MSKCVLDNIYNNYKDKIDLFNDKSIEFIHAIIEKSQFRRCVKSESVENIQNPKIIFVQSGQLGCDVNQLNNQITQD